MSSTRDHSKGRGRGITPSGPLRKPGELRQPANVCQDDEKPPVLADQIQKLELTVNEAHAESGPKKLAQSSYLLNGLCVLYRKYYSRTCIKRSPSGISHVIT